MLHLTERKHVHGKNTNGIRSHIIFIKGKTQFFRVVWFSPLEVVIFSNFGGYIFSKMFFVCTSILDDKT